ncbi:ABC transporter permease [Clostridia bacterium]|nr:ABC transporter permease [Clostridia bacterium]
MKKQVFEFKSYLFNLIKEHKKKEFLGILVTFLLNFSVFVTPYLSRYLIDSVAKFETIKDIYLVFFVFLIACLLQPIFGYVRDSIFRYVSENIKMDIRSKLFMKVLYSPVVFFDKNSKGDVISRITNDGGSLSGFITTFWAVVVNNIIFLLMSLIGMFLLSHFITFVLVFIMLAYAAYNVYIGEKFEKISEKSLKLNDEFYTTIEQNIDNIELIKTFVVEEKTNEQYNSVLNKLYEISNKSGQLASFSGGISSTIVAFAIATIYLLGFNFVLANQMTIGAVVALIVYFQMLIGPIHELISSNTAYRQLVPVLKRLHEYLMLPAETFEEMQNNQPAGNEPLVIFQNVSFGYGDGEEVLSNLSFELRGTGLFGVVGSSGIGKSTVAKLMLRLYKPKCGNVDVYPCNTKVTSLKQLRSEIGYVAQSTELLNVSVRQNLLLGCENNVSEEELVDVCKRLGLHDKIVSLANGYDSIVNEKINFSGGEIQRFAIARVCLKKAPINIFDEITSSLDVVNFQKVVKIIDEMKQKSMVILITHKLNMLDGARKVIDLGN